MRSTFLTLSGCLATSLSAYSITSPRSSTRIVQDAPSVATDTLLGPSDLVTTVPFQLDDSSNMQILLPATMNGRHGIFQLDTGDPWGQLLRQYVKSDDSGNLDTVRAGESLSPLGPNQAPVRVTLGTLQIPRAVAQIIVDSGYAQNHHFQTNLGRVGLNALESLETIIDYRQHRLVLIRLDSTGHRRTAVPAYTPVTTIPMFECLDGVADIGGDRQVHWCFAAHIGDAVDTLVIDTGTPVALAFNYSDGQKIQSHVTNGHLDHLTAGTRTLDSLPAEIIPEDQSVIQNFPSLVGSPFLSRYGIVGINQRTKQLILYQ